MTPAALLLCLVVGVHDGDTITVRCGEQPQQKIRLAEIDAPELKQAFGQKSKQKLSELVYMKTISVEPLKSDRYGRTIARLYVNGREVQWDMVGAGMAWCYTAYLKQPECRSFEDKARSARRGLWADQQQPVPPWEFRRPG